MPVPDVDALAAALGITLQPEWHDTIRLNLEISLRLAKEVAAFPLDDHAEPAPVYTP